jgi:hypothetical protein
VEFFSKVVELSVKLTVELARTLNLYIFQMAVVELRGHSTLRKKKRNRKLKD